MFKPLLPMVAALVGLSLSACAQSTSSEIVVGDIQRDLHWGNHPATFEVTNETDYPKFLTVETEIQFSDSYLKPERRAISHVILPPRATENVSAMLYIPGNYGRADGRITIYDVVDTLDEILPGQKCFEDNFMITFHPPEAIQDYLQTQLTLPPRVEEHPDFDNELARLVIVLINEGRTVDDIAEMTAAEPGFVQTVVDKMVSEKYMADEDGKYKLLFPLITVAEAEQGKKMAEELSDSLVATVKANLPAYREVLKRLVAEGKAPQDSNSFLDGGTILYYPYPLLSGFVLWWDLGQRFITRSAPLKIYDGTDICNAHIPNYMYAVQGGPYFNGTCFYVLYQDTRTFTILFGDSLPPVECPEDFILKGNRGLKPNWKYDEGFHQETFMVDTTVIRPVLQALEGDADSLLVRMYVRLKELAQSHGQEKASYGMRYWFWNLAASRTIVKLVQQGVIERRSDGQFKFERYRGRPK